MGTGREVLILIRRAGKGSTKEMTLELSFENEPDLSEKGHPKPKNEQKQGHGSSHLGVLDVAMIRGA